MEHGMPPFDAESIEANAGWLRALALHLVGPDQADDLVQDTWVRALEKPPRRQGSTAAWLAQVIKNLGANHRRAETRRRQRETRVAERDDTDSPAAADVAGILDLNQQLLEAVRRLAEPFQTAVVLRYYEGLTPREIAAQLDVPDSTARGRLARGMAMLRRDLEAGHGPGWRRSTLAVLGFSGPTSLTPIATTIAVMTTKKAYAVLAALILLPLAAMVYTAEDPAPVVEDRVSLEAAGPAPAPPAPLETVESRAAVVEPEPPSAEPEYLESSTDEDAHLLRVLDAATLRPVPKAEVLWFDRASERDDAFTADLFSFREGMEGLLERYGQRYLTNDDGEVRVPRRRSYIHVAARSAGLYAAHYLSQPLAMETYDEVEFLLRPGLNVDALLLDAAGDPVPDTMLQVGYGTRENTLQRARTDGAGRARFRNLQSDLAEHRSKVDEVVLKPHLPFAAPPTRTLEVQDLPTETVVLRLPSSGSVEVLATTADGDPIPDGAEVWLWPAPAPSPAAAAEDGVDRSMAREDPPRTAARRRAADGRVRFPVVGLGQRLIVAARFPRATAVGTTTFDGPAAPGQVIQVAVAAKPLPATRDYLLVDTRGAPVPSTSFSLDLVGVGEKGGTSYAEWYHWTDAAGRDEFQLQFPEGEQKTRFTAILVEEGHPSRAGQIRWGAHEFEVGVAERTGDLGEIRFGGELFLGGEVVDAVGAPVAGATMRLNLCFLPQDAPKDQNGNGYHSVRVLTDDRGRFEFRGPAPARPEDCELFVEPPGPGFGRLREVEMRPYAGDHRIELISEAVVKGRVLLDSDIDPAELMIRLVWDLEASWPQDRWLRLAGSGVEYRAAIPVAGRAKLELFQVSGVVRRRISSSETFTAELGQECVVPGWQPLDLRGRLHRHGLQVWAGDQALPRFSVAWLGAESYAASSYVARADILSMERVHRVVVGADGYRDVEVDLAGETRVDLAEGYPLQLQLPDGVTLPDPAAWTLSFSAERTGATGQAWSRSRAATGSDGGFASVILPFAGVWTVRLYCRPTMDHGEAGGRTAGSNFRQVPFQGAREFLLRIREGEEGRSWRVPVTQEALDRALTTAGQ